MAGLLSISGVVSFFLLFSTSFALPFLDLPDWTRLRHKPPAYAPFPTLKPNATDGIFETHRPGPTGTGLASTAIFHPTGLLPTAPSPTAPAAPPGHTNLKRNLEDRYPPPPPPPYLSSGFSTGTGTGLPVPTGFPQTPEHHHPHQVKQFGVVRQAYFVPYFPFSPPEYSEPAITPTPTASGIFPNGTASPRPTGY